MILNRQHRVRVSAASLERFFASVRGALGVRDESISICLVSDADIAGLNHRYRGKRGPTDVLSFPADAAHKNGRSGNRAHAPRDVPRSLSVLGDIAISPETARRNARRFGRPLDEELRILILHGVLHLLGYDHEADQGEMERLEVRLRRELKVAGK
jgi:probable rRNA maturation factor